MDLGLKNRKAFITGTSRGIGLEIAKAFAAEGVHLALFGRDKARCEALAAELRAQHPGQKAFVVWHDFHKPESLKPAVEQAAAELGGADILVNVAGGAYRGRLGEIPDEEWERYFRVKPLGLIRMTRETLPWLKKSDQGRIIHLSGTRGREPEAHSMMSGPINLGTLSLTKAMANEFGPFGITVNAIAPGLTLVEATTYVPQERHDYYLKGRAIQRPQVPEDVNAAALFLLTQASGFITGQLLPVNGGFSMN